MKKIAKLSLGAILTLSATGSLAAGFQLAEISTSGLGSSFAGTAVIAENASVVATNPALMTEFNRPEISIGGVYIKPQINIKGSLDIERLGVTLSKDRDASNKNIVPGALVPNIYTILPLNNRFSLGGGINVNYGAKSLFKKDYAAGALGGTTDFKTINFNLSGAAKLGKGFNLGLGLNAVKAEASLKRNAGDLSKINPLLKPSTLLKNLEGKTWGYGWNLGLSYNLNDNNRFGLAYHSDIDLDFTGDFSTEIPLVMRLKLMGLKDSTVPAELSITLPSFWELSAYHKLTNQLALQYSWKYTNWNVFEELKATSPRSAKPVLQKEEGFSNSSRYAVGFTYDATEFLVLRTGIAYEESASKKHPSVSIPDTNRTWFSLGATYKFSPKLSTDLGYAYVYGHKNDFVEVQKGSFTQVLSVKSRSQVNLFGLNLNYKF